MFFVRYFQKGLREICSLTRLPMFYVIRQFKPDRLLKNIYESVKNLPPSCNPCPQNNQAAFQGRLSELSGLVIPKIRFNSMCAHA